MGDVIAAGVGTLVELYRGVHEHPPEYLTRPTFLESLGHLVTRNDWWSCRKMSHGIFMATFVNASATAFVPQPGRSSEPIPQVVLWGS